MWIDQATLVLPNQTLAPGSLQIEAGRIAEIREGAAPRGTSTVDARGLVAMPGIIDLHGDMIEVEAQPRPGVFFPLPLAIHELDKRLVGNGVTTAYAAISFWENRYRRDESVERAADLVGAIIRMRPDLLTDLRIHARYEVTTPSVAPVIAELIAAGQVHMLSLMDHTPGQGQYSNLATYVDAIAKWRDQSRSEIEAQMHEQIAQSKNPALWHTAAEVVGLAQQQRLPIASHDDDTPEKVERMLALGVQISEFPVRLAAARAARQHGLHVALGAPNVLRGGSHTGNLSARDAIAEGSVDMLASDYAPVALVQAIFTIVERQLLPLHEAVALITCNVAAALGLDDRGSLIPGQRADLALIEPGATPRVRGTIRNGLPVYWDGSRVWR